MRSTSDDPEVCSAVLRNGNRLVKILLPQDIPSFVRVESCQCRVWYPRQPPQCSICREFGHRAPACPLSSLCRRFRQPGHVARECTQAWGPSVFVFSPASDESDHAMEQSSPSPSIVASVPVAAQSTPSSVPNECGHVMEELLRSSPKAPAFSTPVSVPAQSVTVSAAPATVTMSASPVTFPVSAIVSVAPVTGSVSPAIVTAPAPATVTASSPMVTASVPTTVTAPVPTSSSGIVPACQVSVTPPTASSDHDFPKFSGDQDTAQSKSRAYIRKCMTKEISGVVMDVRTWSSKNTAHFSSWTIKKSWYFVCACAGSL